jgi:hypothetical protein
MPVSCWIRVAMVGSYSRLAHAPRRLSSLLHGTSNFAEK